MGVVCGAAMVARAQQPPAGDLQALAAAQQAAVESGDRDTIVAASSRLAAAGERYQAALLVEDGSYGPAADLLSRSLTVESSAATELLLVQCAAAAGRLEQARSAAERFRAREGAGAAAAMALANAYHTAHDLPETIAELRAAAAQAPDNSSVHLALGSAAWELNQFGYNAETLHEFSEAQRLAATEFLPNFELGTVLSEYHRYADAERYLKLAIGADARSPDPWLQLGSNAFAEDKQDAAREALETAVRLTGEDRAQSNFQIRRAYTMLSRIAAMNGRQDEARALEAEADALQRQMARSGAVAPLSESTGVPVTVVRPAGAGAKVGAGGSAGGAEERAALRRQLGGVVARSLNDAGTALAREHDYAGALPFFREAAEEDGSVVPVMRNLGLAAFHQAEYTEAVRALEKALEQTPGDALAGRYLEEARQAAATRAPQ